MIEVFDKNIILRNIVEEMKKSGSHSVSADKVTSNNDEMLSFCFRYVDENMGNPRKICDISRS